MDGNWWTIFPPPADFDGDEEGEPGCSSYQRTLSPRALAIIEAAEAEDASRWRREQGARRDLYFGFDGDVLSSGEPEPSEHSPTAATPEAERSAAGEASGESRPGPDGGSSAPAEEPDRSLPSREWRARAGSSRS